MQKVQNIINFVRFEEGNYWIDIIETDDMFEEWIKRKDSAISLMILGVPKKQKNRLNVDAYEFMNWVTSKIEDDINFYNEQLEEIDPE